MLIERIYCNSFQSPKPKYLLIFSNLGTGFICIGSLSLVDISSIEYLSFSSDLYNNKNKNNNKNYKNKNIKKGFKK